MVPGILRDMSALIPRVHTLHPAISVPNALHAHTAQRGTLLCGKQAFASLPHHARTKPRVLEFIDQRRDDLAILGLARTEKCIPHRFFQ